MATEEKMANPSIKEYMDAGYPALFLPTVEPEVAERRVRQAMIDREKERDQFGVWKVTTGLLMGMAGNYPEGRRVPDRLQGDLIDSLAWIEKQQTPVVAIFHNVREYLRNAGVVQQMQDTILQARLKGSHVVLVGPYLDVPPELRSLVTFVDCPLPTREQIETDYRRLIKAYEDDVSLPKNKEEVDDLFRYAATAAVGLDSIGAENALALSLAMQGFIDTKVIQAQKEQEVRKSDVLEFISTFATMDQVGGFSALKEWMRRRQKVFSDEARAYGLPYPKGVLFVGPAGTGKSLAAKAVASYLQLPLLRLDMGKVFRSLVGESEAAIRMALQVTEAVSPVVLWLDEIDKGLAGMRGSGELDSGVTSRVVSTILTWRQETTYPVFLVATANEVASIPSMVYRKGRLDEVWATDLPDENERKEIFSIHLKKRKRDEKKFDLQSLADASDQFTGAEIEACIEDAMFGAFDKGEEVNTKYVRQAIKETQPQAKRDVEEVTRIREWVATRARLVSGKPTEGFGEAKMGFKGGIRQIKSKRGDA